MKKEQLESIKITFDKADMSAKTFKISDLFTSLTADNRVVELRTWAIEKGMDGKAFDKAHHTWRTTETIGGYPCDVQEFIELYVSKNGISARFDGLLEAPRTGDIADHPNIERLGCNLRLLRDKLGLRFTDKAVADALYHWIVTVKHSRLQQAYDSIVSNPPVEADSEWLKLAKAIANTDVASAGYVVCVMKSAIWQVKRKLVDDPQYPVHDHLMPVLCGPQGSGKTQFTMKFFGPISDLVLKTNFTQITEDKNFDLWSYPVLFLDEMEKADKSDAEAVKNAITSETKSSRVLHTGSTATIRRRSTFWGCTNGSLGEKITDTTGLRRFASITAKHAPNDENIANGHPVVDWSTINEIDYSQLWQSVDHKAEHPLQSDATASGEWRRLCEEERSKNSVEAWLKQLKPGSLYLNIDSQMTIGDLYTSTDIGYRDWCKARGYSPFAEQGLARGMKTLSSEKWYPFKPAKRVAAGMVHRWNNTTSG